MNDSEAQIVGAMFSEQVPEGKIRVWIDDGQGGGRIEYRTEAEQFDHCDHCDGTDKVEGPENDRICKDCREQSETEDRIWEQERATQAGMAFGCQGYNDYMGY